MNGNLPDRRYTLYCLLGNPHSLGILIEWKLRITVFALVSFLAGSPLAGDIN